MTYPIPAKYYLIVGETLYHHDIDMILQRCITHEEAEKVLNDFHSGAFGGHLTNLSDPMHEQGTAVVLFVASF